MSGRARARERNAQPKTGLSDFAADLVADAGSAVDLFVTALERRRRVQLAVVVVLSVISAVLLVEVAENAPREHTAAAATGPQLVAP